MTETVLNDVRIVVDHLDVRDGESYDVLKPMVLKVEGDELTISGYNGPDVWRAKLWEIGIENSTLTRCSLPELVEELHRRMR